MLVGEFNVDVDVDVYYLLKGSTGSAYTTTEWIQNVFNLLDIACKILASYFDMPNTMMEASFVSSHGEAF